MENYKDSSLSKDKSTLALTTGKGNVSSPILFVRLVFVYTPRFSPLV